MNVPTITTTVIDQHDHLAAHGSAGLRGLAVRVELLVGLGHDLADRTAGDADHRAGRDLELDVVVAEAHDPAVDTTRREDVVTLLELACSVRTIAIRRCCGRQRSR